MVDSSEIDNFIIFRLEFGICIKKGSSEMNCDITEECDQNDTNNGKDRKLHNQKLMLQCFNDLQKSLHDKNPDRAIKNVERFKSLILPELTTLMLLKYPEVVEVFHSIQCHAGKSNTLELICEEVRERVEHIYVRIQVRLICVASCILITFIFRLCSVSILVLSWRHFEKKQINLSFIT